VIQSYIDNIEVFSDELNVVFFDEVIQQLDNILKFITKDPNETWKFMNFIFSSLKNIGTDR